MSEVKPTIAALRAWLKTCPLIADEQEATGAAFRIAGLEEEYKFSLDASKSNAIYGRSATVQPAAYYVHIWRRVA